MVLMYAFCYIAVVDIAGVFDLGLHQLKTFKGDFDHVSCVYHTISIRPTSDSFGLFSHEFGKIQV